MQREHTQEIPKPTRPQPQAQAEAGGTRPRVVRASESHPAPGTAAAFGKRRSPTPEYERDCPPRRRRR
jgi:hypothetical protein